MNMKGNIMHISNDEKKNNILASIAKGRTNIDRIKFLFHFEDDSIDHSHNIRLLHFTHNYEKFMKNLHRDNVKIFNSNIGPKGNLKHLSFRTVENMKISHLVSILDWTEDVIVPKEFRTEIDNNIIYRIQIGQSTENIISDEEVVDQLIEDDEIVLNGGDDIFIHHEIDIKSIKDVYWSESLFRAIFFLKNKGFYLGINNPCTQDAIQELKSYIDEDEVMMLHKDTIKVDNFDCNFARIIKMNLQEPLSDIIKTKYVPPKKKINKSVNVAKKYLQPEKEDLPADETIKTPEIKPLSKKKVKEVGEVLASSDNIKDQ